MRFMLEHAPGQSRTGARAGGRQGPPRHASGDVGAMSCERRWHGDARRTRMLRVAL